MYSTYCRLNLSIYADTRTVLRAVRRKLRPSAKRGRKHREGRHEIYRAILKEHADARALYIDVLAGRL